VCGKGDFGKKRALLGKAPRIRKQRVVVGWGNASKKKFVRGKWKVTKREKLIEGVSAKKWKKLSQKAGREKLKGGGGGTGRAHGEPNRIGGAAKGKKITRQTCPTKKRKGKKELQRRCLTRKGEMCAT